MKRTRYEYMEVGPTAPVTHLNELGHDGWQIVHSDPWRIVMMREKHHEEEQEHDRG